MRAGLLRRVRARLLAGLLRYAFRLDTTLKIVDFAVRRHGSRTFLIEASTRQKLSFADLDQESSALADELSAQGLRPGDVLAYQETNSANYYRYRLACHKLGVGFMGLPQSLDPAALAACLRGVRAFSSSGQMQWFSPEGANPSTACTLNISSGTTGASPKVVGLSDRNWVESVYGYVSSSEEKLEGTTVFLCTLPLATAGSTTFLPSLLGGVTQVIVPENPEPALLAASLIRYRVNQLYLTPQRLFEFAEWAATQGVTFPSLQKIITGTERAPVSRLREAIAVFGPIIHIGYGMVEALPPLSMLGPRDYDHLGSVGKPLKGVEVTLVEDGRIAVRTKTVGLGYLNDPEKSAVHFMGDRFVTNDYGSWHEGFLNVLGRREDLLTETPRRVFAAEVEDALYQIPGVRRCAALRIGDQIKVFVSLRAPVDRAELEAAQTLVPGEILVVDEIPINGLGKIDRRALAGRQG